MAEETAIGADVPAERPLFCPRRLRKTFFLLCLLAASAVCAGQTESSRITSPAQSESIPRINGPSVYGARPSHPFLYRVPVAGGRPLRFLAEGLPAGLMLNPETGIISGRTPAHGTYDVKINVRNSHGEDTRKFRIVAGDTLALTPPMGWSSWYMAHTNVSDALIRAQADALISTGLADHGYSYVNIDDGWNIDPKSKDPAINGQPRDEKGNVRTNANFPDMKGLTEYLHNQGLKAGIYISPGPRTCAGYEGSYGHEREDAYLFAAWGYDFLKYDLCSYDELLKGSRRPEDLIKPYQLMGSLLKTLDRDMVFNLCEYGLGEVWKWGREVGGNYWRTTDDVGSGIDGSLWKSMDAYGFGEAGKEKWAGPGGWNDPDNILLGQILWQDKLVPTPLTRDEQYTWMTLWSMLTAPLILGSDLTRMDDFTLQLLTNDEVIAVNQDSLGKQAQPILRSGSVEIWAKDLEDGSKAIALFNRGEKLGVAHLARSALSVSGVWRMRDLWEHKELGELSNSYELTIPAHGAKMLQLRRSGPS